MKYQTGSSNFFSNGSAVTLLYIFVIIFFAGKYVIDTQTQIDKLRDLNQQQHEEMLQQQQLIDTMFKYIEAQSYYNNDGPLHRNNKQPI